MKFLPLVLANLGRHKRRTILTIASVALALFLFASLQTVVTTIAATASFGSARRLVSTNATGIVFTLPIAYANRLQAVPGVESVTWVESEPAPKRNTPGFVTSSDSTRSRSDRGRTSSRGVRMRVPSIDASIEEQCPNGPMRQRRISDAAPDTTAAA